MRRVALALAALAALAAGCDDGSPSSAPSSTTSTTLHLPERLPDLLPVARQVLARGTPEGGARSDELLRTCIQLRRAANAALTAAAGSPERGSLDDGDVARAVQAGDTCTTDPKAAAALLP